MTAKESTARESYSWWQAFCGGATPVDAHNNRRLAVATVGWVICFLTSLMVMERFGDDSLAISSAALAVAALSWIPVVLTYLRFLRETDELTRLIQMQAMAVGFALGLLIVLLGRFIERVASFLPDPLLGPVQLVDVLNPAVVMAVSFVATALVLHRWYSR
jgi:hypothetical protein